MKRAAWIVAAVGLAELIAFAAGHPVPVWFRMTVAALSTALVALAVMQIARIQRELRKSREETRALMARLARAENAGNN